MGVVQPDWECSSVNNMVPMDSYLFCRLAHGAHAFLDIIARVAGLPYNSNHALHTCPAIQTNIPNTGWVAKVAHGTRKQGVTGDGLYGDDEAFAFRMSRRRTEAFA